MEQHHWTPTRPSWSGEHRAALHRFVLAAQGGVQAGHQPQATILSVAGRTEAPGEVPQTPLYRMIRHADGQVFHEGDPVTLADAQIMLNDAIADGRVEVGSFLHVEPDLLVIEPPDAAPGT